MRDKKKKGPETRKPADPKRKAETKRLFDSKKKELESQEAQLLLKFLETWTEPTKEDQLNFLWKFMFWLKEKGYHIIDGQTVFCFPFSKLVRLKGLK